MTTYRAIHDGMIYERNSKAVLTHFVLTQWPATASRFGLGGWYGSFHRSLALAERSARQMQKKYPDNHVKILPVRVRS
jgi:hypothetical protein